MEALINVNEMQVIVGIVVNSQQEILIAQRPKDKYKGGLWEFPGGKIEADESHLQALKRELSEEMGIEVLAAKPWMDIQHDYGDRIVFLNAWFVTQFSGEPYGREGQLIAWVPTKALGQFEFPEGNREIITKLHEKTSSFFL
jgi:8-oxo-dGTP diphosphatase